MGNDSSEPAATIRSGPCQQCACAKGLFNDSDGTCTQCSHAMSTHSSKLLEMCFHNPAPYLTHRTGLVNTLIGLLRQKRIIVIRAPPAVGKTTLVSLIGWEIIQNHPDLEPVKILWKLRDTEEISKRMYQDILEIAQDRDKKSNEEVREKLGLPKYESSKTTVFMIDDAVNTYNEKMMWDDLFKNQSQGFEMCFLLICVHGPSDGTHRWGDTESQSAYIQPDRRIELHSKSAGGLQMLLDKQEIRQLVERWADTHVPKATCDESAYDFVESETQGHAGVIQMLLGGVKEATEIEVSSLH